MESFEEWEKNLKVTLLYNSLPKRRVDFYFYFLFFKQLENLSEIKMELCLKRLEGAEN